MRVAEHSYCWEKPTDWQTIYPKRRVIRLFLNRYIEAPLKVEKFNLSVGNLQRDRLAIETQLSYIFRRTEYSGTLTVTELTREFILKAEFSGYLSIDT